MGARMVIVAAVVGLVAAACGGDDDEAGAPTPTGGETPLASEAAVDVVDSRFDPSVVAVQAGGTVIWTQSGGLPHTVTADDGSFDSHPDCEAGSGASCMGPGDTFEQVFDVPGEFDYYCKIHGAPGGVGMAGTVSVT